MYVPPSKIGRLTMDHLKGVTPEGVYLGAGRTETAQLYGDFNPMGSEELYVAWRCDTELWQLSDLSRPTHNGGGTLDKMPLMLLAYAPVGWCKIRGGRDEAGEDLVDGTIFPAMATPTLTWGGRYPVFLHLLKQTRCP